jgi:hypothetical protein
MIDPTASISCSPVHLARHPTLRARCRCSGSVEEQKLVRTWGRRRSRAVAAAAAAASMNAGPVGTGAWPDHDGNSGFLKLKRSKRRKTQWFYTNFLASAHLAHDGG